MQGKKVTIFGGSGLVGRRIVQRLARAGAQIRVGVRDVDQALFLRTMGVVGQVTPIPVNICNYDSVRAACEETDIVINLVGILFEKGSQRFDRIHLRGAENVAKACALHKVHRLIHMSALGANLHSHSRYAKTKGQGEEAVKKIFTDVTILRPSVIFGPEDRFFNYFAQIAVLSPFLPLIGGGKTKFQPVYVGDVADAVIAILNNPQTKSKTFELGGPTVYTLTQIMEFITTTIQRKKIFVSLPFFVSKILGYFLQILPHPPLTSDQVELMKKDSVVSNKAWTFKDLGIQPKDVQAIVPEYLKSYRPHF